jgi:hypothetical protein
MNHNSQDPMILQNRRAILRFSTLRLPFWVVMPTSRLADVKETRGRPDGTVRDGLP